MEASKPVSFYKTATCPSSNLLLAYRNNTLSHAVQVLIRHHLAKCDFCGAEIPLLAHYNASQRDDSKPGEIPINLRILAESLFTQSLRRLRNPARTKHKIQAQEDLVT